jgi:hypothetical protein
MSYTTLVAAKSEPGSIRSWMNYAKIDVEGVLEDAQAMIYNRLRVRDMKASDVLPVAVGAGSANLPDDFIEAILVRDITNNFDLDERDEKLLEGLRSYTNGVLDIGDPAYFADYDDALNFDCKTTTAWKMKLIYYQTPAPLSSSNPKNFLTRKYPQLLRMACLAVAARHNHDAEIFATEQKLLFIEIDELKVNNEMAGTSYEPVRGP